jgi:hypothetical protein
MVDAAESLFPVGQNLKKKMAIHSKKGHSFGIFFLDNRNLNSIENSQQHVVF